MALESMSGYSAPAGSCTIVRPPALCTARSPSVPSRKSPVKTTPISQKPGMAAPVAPPDAALPAAQDPGPNIIEAVQKQLGLKLELRTAPIPVLVVDHVEREPIGN